MIFFAYIWIAGSRDEDPTFFSTDPDLAPMEKDPGSDVKSI